MKMEFPETITLPTITSITSETSSTFDSVQDLIYWKNLTFPRMFFNQSISPETIGNSSEISKYLNHTIVEKLNQYMDMSDDDIYDLFSSSSSFMNKTDIKQDRDALPLVILITFIYALIFVAGVLGNLITCIVISRNKFMHTATNFYLFNLAISDMILLVSGMPPDLYSIWQPLSYPFADSVCILESILCETSANATVLTITAFTVERYIAICHPFRQHTMSKLSRAIKFILAIWLTAFILAMPQAMQFGVIDDRNGKICSVKDDYVIHVFAVSGFVFFVGPMTAICVLYVLIGAKLKKSKLLHSIKRKGCDINNRGMSAQTRVIRMLVAVAVAFFLCWAPFHAQRLLAVYGTTVPLNVYKALTHTSGVMYFLSTCINPLLYNIMSHKFRDAFKITLAKQFGLSGNYQTQNHNYSALLRQNGSIRLTTVTLRPTNYSLAELQKRESDLFLQDGIRANHRMHRGRCPSQSSQSTLLTSISRNDVFCDLNNHNIIAGGCNELISTIDDNSISDSQRIQEIPLLRKQRNSLPADSKSSPSSQNCNTDLNSSSETCNTSKDNVSPPLLSGKFKRAPHSYNRNDSGRSVISNILPMSHHDRFRMQQQQQQQQNHFNRLRHQRPIFHKYRNNNNSSKSSSNNSSCTSSSDDKRNKFTNGSTTTKIPSAIPNNNVISSNDTITKLSTLESLSQKLRHGTRKVFQRKTNNNSNNNNHNNNICNNVMPVYNPTTLTTSGGEHLSTSK